MHTLIISPEAWRGTLAQFILSSLITLQMSSNINWSTKLSTSSQTPLFPLPLSSPAVHVPDLHPRSHLHRHLRLHSGTRFPLLQHVDHLCSHEIPWRQHHLSWLHLCGRQAVRLVITVHSRSNDVILNIRKVFFFLSLLMKRFFQIGSHISVQHRPLSQGNLTWSWTKNGPTARCAFMLSRVKRSCPDQRNTYARTTVSLGNKAF